MQASPRRSVSFNLAGWLWADLLLGMFAIFLAANAVAPSSEAARPSGIDPTPIVMRIDVSGTALLSDDAALSSTEQRRIADEVRDQLATLAPGRHAAIVFAYGAHERAAQGDRIAALAVELLKDGQFSGTVTKAYHELVPGDPGSVLALEIYLDQ
jgi:predicted pyridoxine 5'-phosphate oxidase superfamily flavin-nucleotide-binding protein